MKKVHNNNLGFAHLVPVVIIGVLIFIVGGLMVSRIGSNTSNNNLTADSSQQDGTSEEANNEAANQKKASPKPINTAADELNQSYTPPNEAAQASYDIKTAYGSLKYVESQLKSNNLSAAMSFITPRIYFRSAQVLNTPEDVGAISNACSKNAICQLGVKSTSFPSNYTSSNYNYPYARVEGKTLTFNTRDVNRAAAATYGNGKTTVNMLNIGDNWVIDKITVNGHVF